MKQNRQFLVVDPDRASIDAAVGVLTEYGSCCSHHTRSQALAKPTGPWIGAVVAARLPDGSGLELCRKLLSDGATGSVILAVEEDDHQTINEAALLGLSTLCVPLSASEIHMFGMRAIAHHWTNNAHLTAVVTQFSLAQALTPRESEIIASATVGATRAELSEELGISQNTLKTQIRVLLARFDADTVDGLAAWLIRSALE